MEKKKVMRYSLIVAPVAITAMFVLVIIMFLWAGICRAEEPTTTPNSVSNNGVAETHLTYSHGDEHTGGKSTGFTQGTYNGEGDTEVNAQANSFVDLSGKTNEDNDHPETQQNVWSRAEINSSAEKKTGDVSLSVQGNAREGIWALLQKSDQDFSQGGNNFSISYSANSPSPATNSCSSDQNPNTVSGNGIVFGWTTVNQTDNGMAAETYGEGQVELNGSGQAKIIGLGGINAQSFKGTPNENYSGAHAAANFGINLQNSSEARFGHAQGETGNILEATPNGVFGLATAKSHAETGETR